MMTRAKSPALRLISNFCCSSPEIFPLIVCALNVDARISTRTKQYLAMITEFERDNRQRFLFCHSEKRRKSPGRNLECVKYWRGFSQRPHFGCSFLDCCARESLPL